MKVLFITFRLRASWCKSLKDKRSEVKKILMGLKNRFNVSVCESGFNDTHDIIEISVAALVFDSSQGDSVAERLVSYVENKSDAMLLASEIEYR